MPTASVAIEGASALNRVRWAQAGKEVAVGDSEGRIWIYDVGEVRILFGLWVRVFLVVCACVCAWPFFFFLDVYV